MNGITEIKQSTENFLPSRKGVPQGRELAPSSMHDISFTIAYEKCEYVDERVLKTKIAEEKKEIENKTERKKEKQGI